MTDQIEKTIAQKYEAGFVSDIESTTFEPGLNEDVIRRLSEVKGEPAWMLDWRLKAFSGWKKMPEPHWAHIDYPRIDFQGTSKNCPRSGKI